MPRAEDRILVPAGRGHASPRLFHRRPDVDGDAPAVVVCPGFIQNRAAFELPHRSFLDHLCEAGFHVYALELRKQQGHVHDLASYAEAQADAATRWVLDRHERAAWLGHSMGGLIGVGLPTETSSRLRALVTIGSPIAPGFAHFSARGLEIVLRALATWVSKHRAFHGSRVARGFHATRVFLDARLVRYPLQVWAPKGLDDEELVYALMHSFVDDSWGAFADMLELSHTDGERAGHVPFGERVRALSTPLLAVAGDRDGLAPQRSTRPLFERAGSADKEWLFVGKKTCGQSFGHIDLLIGRYAPEHVWAPVTSFLTSRTA